MALSKSKLTADLKGWMDDGANNVYTLPTGITKLVSIINDYSSDGEDLFGNKVSGYLGAILTVSLLALPPIPAGTAVIGAIQFATGISGDWGTCSLGTLSGPPDMLSPILNKISLPPPVPSGQSDFLKVFSTTYDNSLISAKEMADAIHSMATSAVSTLTYVQNIPLVFPTMTVSGNIS